MFSQGAASTLAIEAELSEARTTVSVDALGADAWDRRPACARRASLPLRRTLCEWHARRPFRRRREAEQALCERRLPAAERAAAFAVGVATRRAADWGLLVDWAAPASLMKPEHAHASSAAVLTSNLRRSARRRLTPPVSAQRRGRVSERTPSGRRRVPVAEQLACGGGWMPGHERELSAVRGCRYPAEADREKDHNEPDEEGCNQHD